MRQHTLGFYSSYDRGLDMCLKLYPKIKEKFPDAEFHVFYGWKLFNDGYQDNPERLMWRDRQIKAMKDLGVVDHGRVSKKELKEWQQKIGIWFYPTYFGETNCITALDCQQNGCVPCVINYAGLKETVGSGVRIDGDIYDQETKDSYLEGILKLMSDEKFWKEEQEKGRKFSKDFTWDKIANQWSKYI